MQFEQIIFLTHVDIKNYINVETPNDNLILQSKGDCKYNFEHEKHCDRNSKVATIRTYNRLMDFFKSMHLSRGGQDPPPCKNSIFLNLRSKITENMPREK